MNDDTEFDYPPAWTPPGVEPPRRHNNTPQLLSAFGHTADEQPEEDPNAYPKGWT